MDFVTKTAPKSFNRQSGAIKAWSFSTLDIYNKCPYRSYLSKVKKIKEVQAEAANRGELIHGQFEDFVRGDSDKITPAMKHKVTEARRLQIAYEQGRVEVEENWGFDANWQPVGYFSSTVWARIKLDAIEHETRTSAVITDWKSGKKMGNEMKHTKQLQLYTIAAFLRYPELNHIEGRMEYTDQASKNILMKTWTREKAMLLLPSWTNAATAMTTQTVFQAKPNTSNCKFCPYSPAQGGQCVYGV